MIRWLLPILLLCSLVSCGDEAEYQGWLASEAQAADEFCGVDTDFSGGSVSNLCPEPDKDHDGAVSSAAYYSPVSTAVDCDDTKWWIKPGFEDTAGCSAGQYRTCQADGTWTSCSNTSAFTCHTGSGHTYWLDPSGQTSSAMATEAAGYAAPGGFLCTSNPSLGCYHALVAGDCVIAKGGSFSGSWSDGGTSRQFYINNRDGTLANPIVIRGAPGAIPGYAGAAKFNGAGSSPTEVFLVHSVGSDYVRIFGLELDGTGDYSNSGIHWDGGTDPRAYWNYIHNIDGNEDNNVSCVKFRNGTVGGNADENIVHDCAETGGDGPSVQNNMQIRWMDDIGDGTALFNIIPNSVVTGGGIDIKHGEDTASFLIQGNFVRNSATYAIATENRDTDILNNWVIGCGDYCLKQKGIGDILGYFQNVQVKYNTVQQGGLFSNDNADTENMAGVIPTRTLAHMTLIANVEGNIVADDYTAFAGGYNTGDCGTGIFGWNTTGSDTDYGYSRGKYTSSNNVFYNSGSNICFSDYGDNTGGTRPAGVIRTSLASWQSDGYDTGSVNADPSLDSDGLSAAYPDRGWMAGLYTLTGGTPTPTPTPSGSGGIGTYRARNPRGR